MFILYIIHYTVYCTVYVYIIYHTYIHYTVILTSAREVLSSAMLVAVAVVAEVLLLPVAVSKQKVNASTVCNASLYTAPT